LQATVLIVILSAAKNLLETFQKQILRKLRMTGSLCSHNSDHVAN